ncbi:MAG: DUF2059 domain-containing protein [Opitutaceae bacterium]
MKTIRLVPVLLAALATGAFAQETPAKLALAHEVIVAMRADHMFDTTLAQTKQASTELTALPPTATPAQQTQAEALRTQIMDLAMQGTTGLTAHLDKVYATVYTDAELNAMKTFFTSPEGQSMMAKQAQIMAQIRPQFQEMQRSLGTKVQQLLDNAKAANAAATANEAKSAAGKSADAKPADAPK